MTRAILDNLSDELKFVMGTKVMPAIADLMETATTEILSMADWDAEDPFYRDEIRQEVLIHLAEYILQSEIMLEFNTVAHPSQLSEAHFRSFYDLEADNATEDNEEN